MKWLILSNGFNMDGRAASLTVTDKLPYFRDAGIEPIIISAVTGKKDKLYTHYQLWPLGPSGFFFDFRHWYQVRFQKKIGYKMIMSCLLTILFPFQILERVFVGLTSQWSWSIPAVWKGYKLIRQNQIKVIYSSGGAWSAHYAAWLLKKVTDIHWIAEIHDPMVIRGIKKNTMSSKYRERNFLKKLENKICTDADSAVWFTQSALNYAKERNPILADKGVVIYPGSFPPGCEESLPEKHIYCEKLSIGHFGSLAKDRSLVHLLEALTIFFKYIPEARDKIRLHVYGAPLDNCSKEAIKSLNMSDLIIEAGRLPRVDILKIMRKMDVLLLLHGFTQWCSECIPSKLYDYFWTNRPILAINNNQDLDLLLEKRQAYLSSSLDQTSIISALHLIWKDWNNKSLSQPFFEPMHARDAAQKMMEIVQKNLSLARLFSDDKLSVIMEEYE